MKKSLIVSLALVATGIVTLTSCSLGLSDKGEKLSSSESLSIEAVAGMQTLGNLNAKGLSPKFSRLADNNFTTEETDKITKEILPTADLLFNNDYNFSSSITNLAENERVTIEGELFSIIEKFTVSIGNINEKYSLIYNEAIVQTSKNGTSKDTDDHDEDDSEKETNEHEIVSSISGYACLGDYNPNVESVFNFYKFESKLEKETENNKTEEEREFIIHKSETDFITISQENEIKNNKNETEFSFSSYVGGALAESYSLSIENKENKSEVELTFNNMEYEIVKKSSDDGKVIYYVEIENESNDTEVKGMFIKKEDGTFEQYIPSTAE